MNPLRSNIDRMNDFAKLVEKYEIRPDFAMKLRLLEGYEFVFICDDSGSMNTPLNDVVNSWPEPPATRWDELRRIVSIVVDLASCLDPDGVDIYFLNRPSIHNVQNSSELIEIFKQKPSGATPIAKTFRQVFSEKQDEILERNLLILLATDGVPTDNDKNPDPQSLEDLLRRERIPIERIPVSIIACTDDRASVDFLTGWDEHIDYLDISDDYQAEREKVLSIQGKSFKFSFGDYVVKILLGAIDPWFDDLNEKRVSL